MQPNERNARTRQLIAIAISCLLVACNGAVENINVSDAAASCAEEKAVLVPNTGEYSRSVNTGSRQAQAFFDQGLRLTYSYYFPEALASFDAALCFDPDNPMIHWGRALAIAPNPNSRYGRAPDDPMGAGKAAIAQAKAKAQGLEPVVVALIDALAVLFDTDHYPRQADRSQAFIEATQELIDQYPADLEAAFLAADAIMMASPWNYFSQDDGSPIGLAGDALAILEQGMERNPNHPGLNHLHIHLLENSHEPERAEVSADRLESLTPRAGHMVHMPGHIYMRVGRYDDAITTNERSLAADAYFVEQWGDRPLPFGATYGLSARIHGGHARNFIQWGSLLQGNSERAITLAKDMAQSVSQERLDDGASLRTPAVYIMTLQAFGRWQDILALPLPPESQPYLRGIQHAARGSAYLAQDNLAQDNVAAAESELAELKSAAANEIVKNQRASVNAATDLLQIAEYRLQGEIASARGNFDEAIAAFQAAVVIQDQLRYMEPPDWMHSTRLYLGQAYLEAGQYAQAEQVFREDLELLQENGWALYGLAQTLKAQDKRQEAESVQDRFEVAWAKADVEIPLPPF
ncbi:MAG: tetratricopeptide repeat protein [Cellvibrionaceae bacterium]